MPRIREDQALFERLRHDLRPLANHFLDLCKVGPPFAVSPRAPCVAFSKDTEDYYEKLPAAFYTIRHDPSGEERLANRLTVEDHVVRIGALTYNHCTDAAYICHGAIEKILSSKSWLNA
jgi:hypothetical protein